MSKDELQDLISEFAGDLAQAEPDPAAWSAWLVLLLEALEAEAYKRNLDADHPAAVELTLERMRDALTDRLNSGRW
jgi:hypothetical protein